MKWLKLTRWYSSRWGAWKIHGTPIYVNIESATQMLPEIGRVIDSEEMSKKPVTERPEETYTTIYFAVSSEGSIDYATVQESPEVILGMIRMEQFA